jgi:hypothetical protein
MKLSDNNSLSENGELCHIRNRLQHQVWFLAIENCRNVDLFLKGARNERVTSLVEFVDLVC